MELEHVRLKRGYELLLGRILFFKAKIRTTSLSRGWVFLLYLLQTNEQILDFVFVILRVECLELFALGLSSLVIGG